MCVFQSMCHAYVLPVEPRSHHRVPVAGVAGGCELDHVNCKSCELDHEKGQNARWDWLCDNTPALLVGFTFCAVCVLACPESISLSCGQTLDKQQSSRFLWLHWGQNNNCLQFTGKEIEPKRFYKCQVTEPLMAALMIKASKWQVLSTSGTQPQPCLLAACVLAWD